MKTKFLNFFLVSLIFLAPKPSEIDFLEQQVRLRPPFQGDISQATYPINSFFDHTSPNYTADNHVQIYTGDSSVGSYTEQVDGETHEYCTFYCYEGHSGIDFNLPLGTPVLAAADGVVELAGVTSAGENQGYGFAVVIRHTEGYRTLYGHLNGNILVNVDEQVSEGDQIGTSDTTGNSTGPHLHFGVFQGQVVYNGNQILEHHVIDPFGWRGIGADPLIDFNDHQSTCLWRSHKDDPVSCNDIFLESGSSNSILSGDWKIIRQLGYGYMMHTHQVTQYNHKESEWFYNGYVIPGKYEVYAWIPNSWAFSNDAIYEIFSPHNNTWYYTNIDQQIYSDQWVKLGTIELGGYGTIRIILSAKTGESENIYIGADSILLRSISKHTFLPILNQSNIVWEEPTATATPTYNIPPAKTSTHTPSPTKTHPPTNTSTPTVAHSPTPVLSYCGSDPLVNKSFEYGIPGLPWQQITNAQIMSTSYAHTGNWSAYLGDGRNVIEDLYQSFRLPHVHSASGLQLNLQFWYRIFTQETTYTQEYDTVTVTLERPWGVPLNGQSFTLSNLDKNNSWEQTGTISFYPLKEYAGETVWLRFHTENDNTLHTAFYIDDVSLNPICFRPRQADETPTP